MSEDNINVFKELIPGTTLLDGKYVIERKIGEGGFGITYKAFQSGLNRTVCIKEYFPSGKCSRVTHAKTIYINASNENIFEKYRQAFVKEAKMLATLHHPNIVEVIDVFDENNTSYMVMNFVNGKTLQEVVEKNGPMPYPDAINYIAQITNAVAYIHERHILHRDIKPDNIMITTDNKAILIDFGSAREFEQDKTQIHTSILTHGYAPTEQYTSNSRKGSYTDIYAIGATLYYTLTATVPIEAAARITIKLPSPKDLVPSIPDEANRTILKAMQVKAENRHQTVKEFMDDLCNIKPSVLVDETIGNNSSKKVIWSIISVSVCIVTAIVFLIFRFSNNKNAIIKTVDFTGLDIYPMVKVEGGTFIMGSENTEEDDCIPHKVTLSDFYIGQFEVSQKFWESIMDSNPSEFQHIEGKERFPVENVSFEDIQIFIARLNSKTGEIFTLPTEAQWEYAARGGSHSNGFRYSGYQYPNTIWYDKERPSPINLSSSQNELGIYQMSGNVAEWCQDYYDSNYYNSSNNSTNPLNQNKSKYRVVRGGSFCDNERECVTVYYRNADNAARSYIGFRLVINGK